jgi:hypothetical protein
VLFALLLAVALGLALLLDRSGNAPSGSVRANNESLPKCSRVTGQLQEQWRRRYEAWLAEINEIGFDVRDLPREELLDYYIGQELRDLSSAVREADVIIAGRASEVTWRPGHGVLAFEVDRRIKGGQYVTPPTVPIIQSGAPYPSPSFCFNMAVLHDYPPSPLLFPGDRAVLFLELEPTGALDVQPWSGQYVVEGGRIKAVESNRFAEDVDGLTLDAFVRLIRSHLDP